MLESVTADLSVSSFGSVSSRLSYFAALLVDVFPFRMLMSS